MTETPEPRTEPTSVAASPANRPSRLTVAALWVAIVAGVVFIVAVVFFSGFALGRHAGGGYHWRHGEHEHGMVWHHHGPPMGPMAPWQGPAGPGGPGGSPGPTTTPAVPSPPTSPHP